MPSARNKPFLFQHSAFNTFNDMFVWRWSECRDPVFLYSVDLAPFYPTGLFPTAFFLYKQYLVLMPETVRTEQSRTRSMIRVHDISAKDFKLVGSYDLPENEKARRYNKVNNSAEAAHLKRLDDRAVTLCRIPDLTFFIFSVPNCQLLMKIPVIADSHSPIEYDDLDQRYLRRGNTMMFFFHDSAFFDHLLPHAANGVLHHGGDDEVDTKKYGRLLTVDFDDYVKNDGKIKQSVDPKFDNNDDYIEKVYAVNETFLVCAMSSGRISVKDLKKVKGRDGVIEAVERFCIPCLEPIQEEYDPETDEELDTDGPSITSNNTGDLIVAFRYGISFIESSTKLLYYINYLFMCQSGH